MTTKRINVDYPALDSWLNKRDAVLLWTVARSAHRDCGHVECWRVGRATVLVLLYPGGRAWDIFSSCAHVGVEASLLDADHRCGIASEVST